MSKRIIRASSFPESFFRLFYHVATTTKPIVINNLDNNKKAYINLRARLNEFRKAYHSEAVASGNPHKIEIADSLYGVVCRDPEEVDGCWQMKMEHKNESFGKALDALVPDFSLPDIGQSDDLPDTPSAPTPPSEALPTGVGDVATKALNELYDDKNSKDNKEGTTE